MSYLAFAWGLIGLMLTLEDLSLGHMPAYLVIKGFIGTLCSSMIREDELHMFECAKYDELRGVYGIASVQHASIHDDDVKCVMNNSKNVPSFWKKSSISQLN